MTINEFKNKYAFLSNFHPGYIKYEGIFYPTAEHAFQAAKTCDQKQKLNISHFQWPREAKNKGRKVKLRADWETVKDKIMKEILTIKFSNDKLAKKLLDTDNQKLVEGNHWHDNYWGNCICDKCKEIKGKNKLGKILMRIRRDLRKQIN